MTPQPGEARMGVRLRDMSHRLNHSASASMSHVAPDWRPGIRPCFAALSSVERSIPSSTLICLMAFIACFLTGQPHFTQAHTAQLRHTFRVWIIQFHQHIIAIVLDNGGISHDASFASNIETIAHYANLVSSFVNTHVIAHFLDFVVPAWYILIMFHNYGRVKCFCYQYPHWRKTRKEQL